MEGRVIYGITQNTYQYRYRLPLKNILLLVIVFTWLDFAYLKIEDKEKQ